MQTNLLWKELSPKQFVSSHVMTAVFVRELSFLWNHEHEGYVSDVKFDTITNDYLLTYSSDYLHALAWKTSTIISVIHQFQLKGHFFTVVSGSDVVVNDGTLN
jgi:hypothetical protein